MEYRKDRIIQWEIALMNMLVDSQRFFNFLQELPFRCKMSLQGL